MLAGECAIHQPKFTRKDELRKLILARYPNLANDATAIAIGLTMNGLVTECDQKREVTPQGKRKLFHQWKATEFFRRCELALKQLPDPKDPLNLYSVQGKSGPRHVKPVAKPQLQAAA